MPLTTPDNRSKAVFKALCGRHEIPVPMMLVDGFHSFHRAGEDNKDETTIMCRMDLVALDGQAGQEQVAGYLAGHIARDLGDALFSNDPNPATGMLSLRKDARRVVQQPGQSLASALLAAYGRMPHVPLTCCMKNLPRDSMKTISDTLAEIGMPDGIMSIGLSSMPANEYLFGPLNAVCLVFSEMLVVGADGGEAYDLSARITRVAPDLFALVTKQD